MSNKTRLQTNNRNLQSLINKANALPDAGSGGGSGGGGVETCYCLILCDAPSMESCTATYTNASMQLTTRTFDIMDGARIELAKGTIITLSPWTSMDLYSGDCTKIFSSAVGGGAYFIAGDSNITYA